MIRKSVISALCANSLLAGMLAPEAQAQRSDQITDSPSTPSASDLQAPNLHIGPSFGIDFNSPRSGDEGRSFGRANAFFPLFQSPGRNLTFLSTTARLDSTGRLGGNLALGHRFAVDNNTLLGGYIAYDIRDTGRQVFNQVGLGAELFGNNWQASLNGYIPVGTSSAQVGGATATNQVTNTFFQGNQLFLVTGGLQEFESALGSVDVGAGVKLGDFGDAGNLWGYGTAYYVGDVLGGSLQLDHRLANRFRIGLGAQSDGIFGTQVFFSIGASIGGPSRRDRGSSLSAPKAEVEQRTPNREGTSDEAPNRESSNTGTGNLADIWAQAATAPIRRNSSVVVRSEMRGAPSTTIAAVNPTTGQAYQFRHVVPNAASANQGDGSVTNPFTTLGATTADAANTGLRGASTNDVLYVQAGDSRTNNLTPFTIPTGVQVFSNVSASTLSTQFGAVALPSSGSGVRPLVNGGGANAVTLDGGNNQISGFEIVNGSNGVNITTPTGTVVVENNLIRNSTNRALFLNQSTGQASVTLANNTVETALNDGFRVELTGDANLTLAVTGNQISNITDTNGDGIDLEANGTSTVALNIANNRIDRAQNSGIELETCGNSTAVACISNFTATVTGNTVTNSGGDGILLFQNSDRTAQLTVSNNQVQQSGTAQTGVTRNPGNPLPITGNGGYGIAAVVLADGGLTLTIDNNTITDSQDEKIAVINNFSTNTASAATTAAPTVNVAIQNNQLSGTGTGALANNDISVFSGSPPPPAPTNTPSVCLQTQNNTAANGYFFLNGVVATSIAAPALSTTVLPAGTFQQTANSTNVTPLRVSGTATFPTAPLNALGPATITSAGTTNTTCILP